MPKNYRSYRKRRGYKRVNKRRLLAKISPLRKNIPNYKRLCRFTFSTTDDIGIPSGQTGVKYVQVIASLNFPTFGYYFDGVNAPSWGPLSARSNLYAKLFPNGDLFDQYRVNAVSYRFMPFVVQVDTANDFTNVSEPKFLYQFNDLDDPIYNSSGNPELGYMDSGILPKCYTNGRQITGKFIQPKANKGRWINMSMMNANNGNPYPVTSNVFTIGTTPFENIGAALKLCLPYRANTTVATPIGRVYFSWDVTFKGIDSSG